MKFSLTSVNFTSYVFWLDDKYIQLLGSDLSFSWLGNELVCTIELATLQELMDLINKVDYPIIVGKDNRTLDDGTTLCGKLEIYDDYRE